MPNQNPNPFASPIEVQELCRKYGITTKPPLSDVQLRAAEHGKQTRKPNQARKKNRYLPDDPMKSIAFSILIFAALLTALASSLTAVLKAADVTTNAAAADHNAAKDTTNAPPQIASLTLTNGTVYCFGKPIGRIDGTNYVAVPDLDALAQTQESGFNLGVRFGAVAARRNPDVNDWNGLIGIAKALLKTELPNVPTPGTTAAVQRPGKPR